jgi:hypothetical protein
MRSNGAASTTTELGRTSDGAFKKMTLVLRSGNIPAYLRGHRDSITALSRVHFMHFLLPLLIAVSVISPALSAADPLKDGRYSGTVRFLQSSPAGCPADICTRSIPVTFTLKKRGKRFAYRENRFQATLVKGRNGVFSGYAGSTRAGSCVLDVFPGAKGLRDKGFILAAFIFTFRCNSGTLTALYSGRVRKR